MAGFTNALYEATQGALAGFGAGIVTNTVFTVGTGTTITSVATVISGGLVVALTVLGFGIGLMSGHKKDKLDDKNQTITP